MLTVVGVHEGMTVLDVGGNPATWSNPSIPKLNITILNLPGGVERMSDSRHDITYVEGDGCDIANVIDHSFDFVFSNSVIEHVGGADRQAAFAHEIRRVGKAYWVQTPSLWFPVEAHTGMPWWWCYPRFVQRWFVTSWNKKLPEWTEMIKGTTVLKKSDVRTLFPEATVLVERVLGIPKSYIAVQIPMEVVIPDGVRLPRPARNSCN